MLNASFVKSLIPVLMGVCILQIAVTAMAQDQNQSLRDLNESVVVAVRNGDFGVASNLADKLLERAKTELGESNANYRFAALNVAEAYKQVGNAEKARSLYSRLLEIWPKDDRDRHMLLNNYGVFLSQMAFFEQSKELLEEAVAERQKFLGTKIRLLGKTIESLTAYLHLGGF